jgi:hypothetical protein
MEQLYRDPHTLLRIREGPLGAYADEIARQLSDEEYSRPSCRDALQVLADLGHWLNQASLLALSGLDCLQPAIR